MTATAPPETAVEVTQPFTDAERAELGDLLAAAALADDIFDRIDRYRVLCTAAEAGQWLSEDDITQRVAELQERDRAEAQRAENAANTGIEASQR